MHLHPSLEEDPQFMVSSHTLCY